MDCESSATLTAFAEGRLDGRKRGRVEAHLPGCGRCRLALERIENARATLRAMSEWTPPLSSCLRCSRRFTVRSACSAKLLSESLSRDCASFSVLSSGHW